MDSLMAAYLLETQGKLTVFHPENKGFTVYVPKSNNVIHIDSCYVSPEYRQQGIGYEMEQQILQLYPETEILSAVVDTDYVNPSLSMKAQLGAGFRILKTEGTKIILYKEIKNGGK